MKQPTIFFGATSYVLPIIEYLTRDYDLKLVITTEPKPTDAVTTYCRENTIPVVRLTTFKGDTWPEIRAKIENWHIEFAVLAHFGLIIRQPVLDLFPKGIINIHPSRLPHYRGATPGQTAILLGDVRTGVSIMLLDSGQDHGPILAQVTEEITETDTAASLYKRLFDKGTELLQKVLPAYLSGDITPVEQNHKEATETKLLTRTSGFIDATGPISPGLLDRTIRAFFPWPGAWTSWEMASGKSRIVKFLPDNMIQVEGKKPMSYKDFINGYPEGKAFLEKLHLL